MTRTFAVVALILLVTLAVANAQVVTGTPKFGSFTSDPDLINLGNLNVHFTVPVLNKTGRGLPFQFDITKETSVWYVTTVNGQQTWQPTTLWGWQCSAPH